MIKPGLVSITFRKLSVQEIAHLAAKAELVGIEWGGDVHVPHGDVDTARAVKKLTADAGLEVAAYGSYYRCDDNIPFGSVLKTAVALGAPLIRVWAGTKGSANTSAEERAEIVENVRKIADMAATEGIKIAFEYHGKTLTDEVASTIQLLQEVDHSNVYTYWQPLPTHSLAERLTGLEQVKPWLTNLHVFSWTDQRERLPLAEGESFWQQYFSVIKDRRQQHYAMIEFVKDDKPEHLLEDAKTLHQWLTKYL
ncbi:MAG TPA: TIM barrel protein [Firmicutes bacterium]|nr:TIM barrel protein [Bacillota bacterium]